MKTEDFLKILSDSQGVSGYEYKIKDTIISAFDKYSDEIRTDNLGNIIAIKKGTLSNNKDRSKIMLAAHMDEIGLIVTDIEDGGFIRFSTIGGIDPRTLLGQEVIVHGKKNLFGIIGAKPPHLQEEAERNNSVKIEDMSIDLGLDRKDIKNIVQIGDSITIKRELIKLQGNRVTGKALDDRAGVVTLYECIRKLNTINHHPDIYFVSTVQEEVGCRGAVTSAYNINPDIGIAIDVGFGSTPELPKEDTLEMGKGPGITLGGNIHPGLREKLVSVAKDYNIPFQLEVDPGPTGTDARAIQITRQGIPTLCISIPLRYMHTSVEVVDLKDIENTAKLLTFFISSISNENLEGSLCY